MIIHNVLKFDENLSGCHDLLREFHRLCKSGMIWGRGGRIATDAIDFDRFCYFIFLSEFGGYGRPFGSCSRHAPVYCSS